MRMTGALCCGLADLLYVFFGLECLELLKVLYLNKLTVNTMTMGTGHVPGGPRLGPAGPG